MAHNGKTTNSSGWNAVFSWIKYALTGKRDETKAVSQSSVSASSLVDIDARLRALEEAYARGQLGDVEAESLNAPLVLLGGVVVSPNDHTHQVKINGTTKTIAKTGGKPVDLGTFLTQHQDISGKADVASVVNAASYDSVNHLIVFKHGSTQLFTLDAAAFVKDGMVDSVVISNGNLVITFNTDAGKQPISIPLTDIFDPSNYYTKTQTDSLLSGKQDSLPTSETPSTTYAINVSGTAAGIANTSLGQVNTLPVASMVSSDFKAGTFLLKATSDGGSPYVFGNVTIPNNQWYRFSVSGEGSNYCVITLEPCTGGSSSPFNIFKILVDNGSSRTDKVMKVVRVPYESTTSAVGDSSKPIYVDESGEIKECNPSSMSVGYASAAESGSALAQAIAPDADVALIVYGDATYSSVKALYNARKKLYLVTGGSIQPSGKFEYRIPLTLITYDANNEVNAFYFEQTQDDRAGASEVGSIAVYRLDSTGWTTTPKQVGYAANAGHAANADTATNATNDNGGAKIRDAYISNVVEDYDSTPKFPSDSIRALTVVSVAANQDGFRVVTIGAARYYVPRVDHRLVTSLTVRKPNVAEITPNNVAYIINNTGASYGYNGFTCIGHENPLSYGQKSYGICKAATGALVEIDFDTELGFYNHVMDPSIYPPNVGHLYFAATWDNNDFKYGFPLDDSNIFALARQTFYADNDTTPKALMHVRMTGVIGNAGDRRIFIGAYQPRSDCYITMKASNIHVKFTKFFNERND